MVSRILGLLMWLFLSLIIALKFHSDFVLNFSSASYLPCLVFGVLFWFVWALLARAIPRLSRWFYGRDRNWIRFLTCHLVAGALIAWLNQVLMASVFQLFYSWNWFPTAWYPLSMMLLSFAIYVAMVAIEHAVDLSKRNAGLEVQKAQLDAELSDARLQALKMQLHPHFFFNSLNTVRMLIETDTGKAVRMTTLLGDFLRTTLENNDENEVSFAKELEFIQGYLEIQQIRFEDRIQIDFDIRDQSLKAMVPYLILQPIVENAMLHGCGKTMDKGRLSIAAHCSDCSLIVKVQDSGCGKASEKLAEDKFAEREFLDSGFSEGIGLANTRSRLQRLYGDEGRVVISSLPAGGTLVELQMPLQLTGV